MRHPAVLPVVLLAALLSAPPPALAADTLRPPVQGDVLLAFGVPYASRVHHGLDLVAEEGESVSAPAAGTVVFAGRLPGEDGALGVTLQMDDGLKVTCLPLVSAEVAKGQRVEAGTTLGDLSGAGDSSSERTHVHLSVRRGESYLDPAPLLATPPPPAETDAPAGEPEPASSSAPAPQAAADAPATAPQGSAAPAATGEAAPASGVQGAPAGSPAAAPSVMVPNGSPALAPLRSAASSALGSHALRAPRRITRVSPSTAGGALSTLAARMRSGVAMAAELLVALALLVPAWRRLSRPVELGEAVPVRSRS